MQQRTLPAAALLAVIYSTIATAVFFVLGVVARHALALTPVVFLLAGIFFFLTAMTYAEGATLRPERGGSTVFARYAFNELVSFITGWAVLLDYIILIAVAAFSVASYLGGFYAPLGRGLPQILIAIGVILYVAWANIRGSSAQRFAQLAKLAIVDWAIQLTVIALGFILVFNPDALLDPIRLGHSPSWSELIFALTLASIAFTGLESAASLVPEAHVSEAGLRRLVKGGTLAVIALYVGIALVGLAALPIHAGHTALAGRWEKAPLLGIVHSYRPELLVHLLSWAVAATATVVLIAAANGPMLGLSRLTYSLATHRQIPSSLGRLHPQRATPYVAILLAAAIAIALVIPGNLNFLVGIYAFGAMLAFTLAHLSICRLRFREPAATRPYRIPGSVAWRGGSLPLPAVLGALAAAAGWVSVVVLHAGARLVGGLWLVGGVLLYVIYRRIEHQPILRRVTVPEQALRPLATEEDDSEYGSILVPLLGSPLDDDIVQTAARLASENAADGVEGVAGGAVIEALWIFIVPLSLPIDAALPESQLRMARSALARAKAVGEEYEGVAVATATVRARRAGQAIVDEARRRGVEAIVLAAEAPSRIGGGPSLGGRASVLESPIGDITRYVIDKAPCRIILTAPPEDGAQAEEGDGAGARQPPAGTWSR